MLLSGSSLAIASNSIACSHIIFMGMLPTVRSQAYHASCGSEAIDDRNSPIKHGNEREIHSYVWLQPRRVSIMDLP